MFDDIVEHLEQVDLISLPYRPIGEKMKKIVTFSVVKLMMSRPIRMTFLVIFVTLKSCESSTVKVGPVINLMI